MNPTSEAIKESKESSGGGWLLLAVCLTGLLLRIWNVPDLWINPDEGIYFQTATKASPVDVLKATAAHAHPPLYYLILWVAASVSTDLIWLRLPSLLFGMISIWGIYRLGNHLFSRTTALIMALIWAALPATIISAQTLRPYPLLLALLPFTVLGFSRMVDSDDLKDSRLYSITLATLILVHYGGFLVFFGATLALGIIALSAPNRRNRLANLLNAYWIPGFSFLLVCSVNLQFLFSGKMIRSLRQADWLIPMYTDSWSTLVFNFTGWIGYLTGPNFILPIVVLAAIGSMVLLFLQRSILLLTVSILFFSLLLSIPGLFPFGGSRHTFYLAPLLIVFVGAAIHFFIEQGGAGAVIAAAISLVLAGFGAHFHTFLDAQRTPLTLHPPQWEQIVSRADIEAISSSLHALPQGQHIALDQQTFHLLIPVFRGEYDGKRLKEQHTIEVLSPYRFTDYNEIIATVNSAALQTDSDSQLLTLILSGWGRSSILDELVSLSSRRSDLTVLSRANNLLIIQLADLSKATPQDLAAPALQQTDQL